MTYTLEETALMNQGFSCFFDSLTDIFRGDRQKGSAALSIIWQRNVVVLVVFVDILYLMDTYFCTMQIKRLKLSHRK